MANKLCSSGDMLQSVKTSNNSSENCSIYLFPMASQSVVASAGGLIRKLEPSLQISPISKGHYRSASHGGVGSTITSTTPFVGSSSGNTNVRPSALKKGHKRAFSQGQIIDSNELLLGGHGHTRTSSKTDFILPDNHRDYQTSDLNIFEKYKGGHSRQASRSESVYTLRHHAPPSFWKQYLCFFSRKKQCVDDGRFRTIIPSHLIPLKCTNKAASSATSMSSATTASLRSTIQSNKICTTKYTLLSFLPKNLLEQFHRVANLYFIFIVLLNWFPSINAFGKEIAMIPVLFVLGVTAMKDLFEDRRRHSSDKRINYSTCRTYNNEDHDYKNVLWKDIKAGDLVKLTNNEVIPADILVLRSSDGQGLCYIDTCNLDGESNLKQRQVVSCFVNKQRSYSPELLRSVIEVEAPTTKIYRFHGAIIHPDGEKVAVTTDNLLLRECILKNTDFVEGIVIYAGHETKAMLNNNGPRYKRSSLEKQMNTDIMWCVVILMMLCLIGAVGNNIWISSFTISLSGIPFLPYNDEPPRLESLLTFCTFVIILQVMIPLSLYVTIEMTKLLQVFHINNNINLYDADTNKRLECRALNITEQLGQVQYIFSDKTGTLTENKMLFRRCSIAGVDYNHPSNPIVQLSLANTCLTLNQKLFEDLNSSSFESGWPSSSGLKNAYFSAFRSSDHHSNRVKEFMLVLALCNTVVIANHSHNAASENNEELQKRPLLRGVNVTTTEEVDEEEEEGISNIPLHENRSSLPHVPSLLSADFPDVTQTDNNRLPVLRNTQLPLMEDEEIEKANHRRIFPMKRLKHFVPKGGFSSRVEAFPMGVRGMFPTSNFQSTASGGHSNPCIMGSDSCMSLRQRLSAFENLGKSSLLSRPKFLTRRFHLGNKTGKSQINAKSVKPIFEAESPDELALVETAYCYNCRLVQRSPISATVLLPGYGSLEFEVLKVLPFDSSRKCMSIVLKHPISGEIIVFSKGADSSILPLINPTSDPDDLQIIFKTQQHLNMYARQGLRILVMAKRVLTEKEYNEWAKGNRDAELSINDREKKISQSYSQLEKKFTLLGATGIEDRLQDGVPETIASLRTAGIVIWVLTGDKLETAINVAYSTKLFTAQMEIIRLTARSKDSAQNMISFYLKEIETSALIPETSVASSRSNMGLLSYISSWNKKKLALSDHLETSVNRVDKKERALVIDGKTLTFILDRRSNLQVPFLRLTQYCTSVLCCRSTPLQKAYIVRVVKDKLKMRTLAIGDGANDVSMIQSADVGIGISGQEGMQAVMASDFALSKFKFLERLLLVHGHWNYDRLANMVLYFFYKNTILVFLIFWYQLYCGFSGTVMIDQMYLMLYNLFFTSIPPLIIGVYDQNAPEELLLEKPELYSRSRLGLCYKTFSFWLTTIDAIYQSLVIFYIIAWTYNETDVGIWEFGMTSVTACMFTMLLQACLETRSWTIMHAFSIAISLGSFYLFSIFYNMICFQCMNMSSNPWVLGNTFGNTSHWLIIIITTIMALLPRLIFYSIKGTFQPDMVTAVVMESRQRPSQNDDISSSWSRATSTSIYRTL